MKRGATACAAPNPRGIEMAQNREVRKATKIVEINKSLEKRSDRTKAQKVEVSKSLEKGNLELSPKPSCNRFGIDRI